MRISDWSSDVCSSDLRRLRRSPLDCRLKRLFELLSILLGRHGKIQNSRSLLQHVRSHPRSERGRFSTRPVRFQRFKSSYEQSGRSEEHTSELQSLMRISYAVFRLKKTNNKQNKTACHNRKANSILIKAYKS